MLNEAYLDDMAINAIRNYLNVEGKAKWNDTYIMLNYDTAIELIKDNYKSYINVTGGVANISSISQGGQSISFNNGLSNSLITEEVKSILPKPYIKLF